MTAVEAVQDHAAETEDHRKDVQHEHDLVEIAAWTHWTCLSRNSLRRQYRRYLLPPWQPTPRPTSCWRRSTASRRRSRSGSPRSTCAFVALDPYTDESAWMLETAGRILKTFEQADVRVAFLVTVRRPTSARSSSARGPRTCSDVRRPRPRRGQGLRPRAAARLRPPGHGRHDRRRGRGLAPGRVAHGRRRPGPASRPGRPRRSPRRATPARSTGTPSPSPDPLASGKPSRHCRQGCMARPRTGSGPARYLTMPPLVRARTSRALSSSASVIQPRSSTSSRIDLPVLVDSLMTSAAFS